MISTKKLAYKIVTKIADLDSDITTIEPIGSIKMYGGSTAPSKWLICDGSAISRTTYSALFGVIGTSFGTGDGSTTFNLPDLRGRTPIGAGTGTATDATAHTLGSTGGTEKHTLSKNEMPSHTHAIQYYWSGGQSASFGYNFTNNQALISSESQSSGGIVPTGGGQAHNNMQPYTAVNFIIFAGA